MSKQDDKQPNTVTKDEKPTPAGTVELKEEALDKAVGGQLDTAIGTQKVSIAYKIQPGEIGGQKYRT